MTLHMFLPNHGDCMWVQFLQCPSSVDVNTFKSKLKVNPQDLTFTLVNNQFFCSYFNTCNSFAWANPLQTVCIPSKAFSMGQQRPVWQLDVQPSTLLSWLLPLAYLVCSTLIKSCQIWSCPNTPVWTLLSVVVIVAFDVVWLEKTGHHLLRLIKE